MLRSNWGLIFLLVISGVVLFINSGSYGVMEPSEARYAEIAREMYVSGDYLHPRLLDIHHYHKPPVTYQLTAIAYNIFGINAFAARFFLQIAILFQLVLVYATGLLLFENRRTALWAAGIYFSFPLVLISTRNLTTDAFLNTFVLLSLYAWIKYRKDGKVFFLYLFTLSLALGFLTKGPVVFIVPLPFIFAYNRLQKTNARLSYHHALAWLLFLVIGTSWYFYLVAQDPDFFNYFLGRHTVDRFAGDAFGRTEPFWYFILLAPAAGMPWFMVLISLSISRRKRILFKSVNGALLVGILVPLFFFSISSSKRILYILPFYSLAALLTANLLAAQSERGSRIIVRIMLAYVLLFSVALISTHYFLHNFHVPLLFTIAGAAGIPIFIYIYNSRWLHGNSRPVMMTYLLAVILVVTSGKFLASNELKIHCPAPLTDFVRENGLDGRPVLIYDSRQPSIAFELDKPVISLYDGNSSLNRETQFETDDRWKSYFVDMHTDTDLEYLKQILKHPAILITYKKGLPARRKWLLEHFEHHKQFEKYGFYY